MKTCLLFVFLFNFFTISTLAADNYDDLYEVQDKELNSVTVRVAVMTDNRFSYCSGVLYKKNIVLTARHCLENKKIPYIIIGKGHESELIPVSRVSTIDMPKKINNMLNTNGETIKEYSLIRHKLIANDILALHLEKESSYSPATIIPSELNIDWSKQAVFTVGFPGRSQKTLVEEFQFGTIPKNVGNMGACYIIDGIDFSKDYVFTSDCIVTGGNSGGPLFTYIDNKLYLVGINSTGTAKTGNEENFLGSNRALSEHINLSNLKIKKWLDSIL
jgi:hypothetical protein